MKRRGLARALQARKEMAEEPERKAPEQNPAPTKAATPRRFHTTIYPDSREFYDDVRVALIREGKGRDFNRLVNDLLAEWLDAHGE
jgi:hypothetical protein